jgi:hypothetical protein
MYHEGPTRRCAASKNIKERGSKQLLNINAHARSQRLRPDWDFTAHSAKSTRISRQLLGRCHGYWLTLDNVARDGENVECAGSKRPARDQFDLVDDDLTRWCIVAAILLDGPDPLAPPNIEREGQDAAATHVTETKGGNDEAQESVAARQRI